MNSFKQAPGKILIRVAAWLLVAGTIYLYQLQAFGAMCFMAASAMAMFVIESRLRRHGDKGEIDAIVMHTRMAQAFFVVATAGFCAALLVG